jgi:hypothetical protein
LTINYKNYETYFDKAYVSPDKMKGVLAGKSELREPIKDTGRFPWQKLTRVAHYRIEVNAMTRPMTVRQADAPFGKRDQ